jgi:Holliday junction resolvase
MSDANLRQIFRKHLPDFDFQSVETWSTGRGVPDINFCHRGIEGWIECKQTSGWRITIAPEQVAWIERRLRSAGRAFIAVRRQTQLGPRRGAACDELWLFRGECARELIEQRIDHVESWHYAGGPARWDWSHIKLLLTR